MWHDLSVGRALKLLAASAGAVICSLAIAMVIGRYVPQVYDADYALRPDPTRIYTEQELAKAEKDAIARDEDIRRLWREKTFADVVYDLKIHALWGVWLPWLLLPFVTRIKNILFLATVMIVPASGTFIHLVPLEELFVISISIATGVIARDFLVHRKHAT